MVQLPVLPSRDVIMKPSPTQGERTVHPLAGLDHRGPSGYPEKVSNRMSGEVAMAVTVDSPPLSVLA